MSDWEISPYVGIGALRLGMPRNEVHALMGSDFRTVRGAMDSYRKLLLNCHFDSDDKLEFIEVMRQRCAVVYKEQQVFKCDVASAVALLSEGAEYLSDSSGYTFTNFGVTLYTPRANEISAVGVFRRGYFEKSANE